MENQQSENKIKNKSNEIRNLIAEIKDEIKYQQSISPSYEQYIIKKKIENF